MFIPHSKQREILSDTSKELWIFGGNRSGKTELVIAAFVLQLVGKLPSRPLAPRVGGWQFYVASTTKSKQREVIQDKFNKYLPSRLIKQKKDGTPIIYQSQGVWDHIELVDPRKNDPQRKKRPYSLHGARIWFKSYEEGVTGFEGSSIDAVINDEEPPKDIYEAEKARLVDRKKAGNGYMSTAMTPDPDNGITWTYDDIIEKEDELPEVKTYLMSTYENKVNLGEEEIKNLERDFGATVSKARIYGLHVSREGLVLDQFRPVAYPEGNIIPSFKPDWKYYTPYESTDWGYKHPWHWGFYAVSPDGEIIKYDEIHVTSHTTPMMKELIYKKRKYYDYKHPAIAVGDPSMSRTQSNGTNILDELSQGSDKEPDGTDRTEYERGRNVWIGEGHPPFDRNHKDFIWYPVIVSPANNDRDEGWKLLNKRMRFEPGVGRPEWYYTENCYYSIKEAKNLQYPKDSNNQRITKMKEIARKKKDEGPDTDRYLSNFNPVFIPDYDPKYDMFDYDDKPKSRKERLNDGFNGVQCPITGW